MLKVYVPIELYIYIICIRNETMPLYICHSTFRYLLDREVAEMPLYYTIREVAESWYFRMNIL